MKKTNELYKSQPSANLIISVHGLLKADNEVPNELYKSQPSANINISVHGLFKADK